MERELDNVRAALQWARAVGDDERGLRIAAELESFWERRGSIAEGRSWIDGILAKSGVQARCAPATHIRGLLASGVLALRQEDVAHAVARFELALQLASEAREDFYVARANMHLGMAAQVRGDYETTLAFYERAMPQWYALEDPVFLVAALNNSAAVLHDLGRTSEAEARLEECIALARSSANVHILALALANLGKIRQGRGDASAEAPLLEALRLMRAARDRFGTLNTLCFLGEAAETSGDHARALRFYHDSMRINREFVDSRDRLAEARGDFDRALLLLVAARRERERIRVPGTPLEQETARDFLARICERVPESAFTRAIEFARVRPFDDIVADELAIAREDDAPVNG